MEAIKKMVAAETKEIKKKDEEEEEVQLPGFRFHPTDEELVGFYLKRKVENKKISIELIKQLDIYKHDPWDLPKIGTHVGDKEWYFFCIRGRKYRNSVRPNRVTGSGFWKATGIDKPVYSSGGRTIGLKKSLVYYRGSAGKGSKTDWMMHEFRLPPALDSSSSSNNNNNDNVGHHEAEVWTLCRIFKRTTNYKRCITDWRHHTTRQSSIIGDINKTCGFVDTKNINLIKDVSSSIIQLTKNNNEAIVAVHGHQHEQRNQILCASDSIAPSSYSSSTSNTNFWSSPQILETNNCFFGDANWDELKSVVDLATDPRSFCYSHT